MAVEHLFTQALGLSSPWKVVSTDFDPKAKTLDLVIDFERGARFADPESGELCPVHDTAQRSREAMIRGEELDLVAAKAGEQSEPSLNHSTYRSKCTLISGTVH